MAHLEEHYTIIYAGVVRFAVLIVISGLGWWVPSGATAQEAIFVDASGRVGIGTSAPNAPLVVHGTAPGDAVMRVRNTSPSGYSGVEFLNQAGTTVSFMGVSNGGAATRVNSIQGYPLLLMTESVERVRIAPDGNVGIGTTAPSRPLEVARAGAVEVAFFNSSSTHVGGGSAAPTRWFFQVDNDPTRTFKISQEGSGGAELVVSRRLDGGGAPTLKVDGSVQATNVVYSSSRRLKTEVVPVDPEDLLERLAGLAIAEWSYAEDPAGERHIGPMAEDFNALFGAREESGTISLPDASGVALAAIQALLARVEHLTATNESQQATIRSLERRLARLEAKP